MIVSPIPASEQDTGLAKWECGAAPAPKPGVLHNFLGQSLSEYHGELNAPSSQRTLLQGESIGKRQLPEHPGFPMAKFTKQKWEIAHQATCTKHKDLQHRQQSSCSGGKIRIPRDVREQRHNEQMVQELQLSKGDTLDQRMQRVPKGTVLTAGNYRNSGCAQGRDGTTQGSKPGFHMQIMDCAQGSLLNRSGVLGSHQDTQRRVRPGPAP